jgi:glyoxylase-like metal-dependent hydrolase (beta-lactamase superfamily II)
VAAGGGVVHPPALGPPAGRPGVDGPAALGGHGAGGGRALAAALAADPDDAPAAITSRAPVPFPGAADATTADPDGAVLLAWDGPQVRVLRHAAHSVGHTALVVVDSGVLIAGDLLSDVEVPLLDGPAAEHRAVLDRLGSLVARYRVRVVVPGHGTIGDPVARLAADRAYLDRLGDPEPTDPRLGADAPEWLRAADREQRGG